MRGKRSKNLSEKNFYKLMSNWKMQKTFLPVTGDKYKLHINKMQITLDCFRREGKKLMKLVIIYKLLLKHDKLLQHNYYLYCLITRVSTELEIG